MFRLHGNHHSNIIVFSARFSLFWGLFLAIGSACTQCGGVPSGPPPDAGPSPAPDGGGYISCETHDDCPADYWCAAGLCKAPNADAGYALDAGNLDAGLGDASAPESRLDVLPGLELEFGAQLLGVTVTRDLILQNGGNANLTIFAVILDDDSGEFEAAPTGTLGETLAPGDALVITVSHTPADGVPDFAELNVLHDGPSSLANISLFAEFKGDAALSLTQDIDETMPNLAMLSFGEVFPGELLEQRILVRNTGRSDSILTLSDITITPESAGFELVDEIDFPYPLGAWSAAACVDNVDDCPPSASSCEDGICLDEDDAPLFALPLRIAYQAGDAPAMATLTLEHDAAGVQDTQTDIVLTGAPSQPEMVLSVTELVFGNVLVGAPAAVLTFEIANQGQGPLRIERLVPPQNGAFSVSSYPNLPDSEGQIPYTLLPEDAPIVVEVSFAPNATNSFAGFLQVESNDPAHSELTVPISGTGISCQANAFVSEEGTCECNERYRECGGECLLAGPDACGPSCIQCDARSGAERACVDDQCVYSCNLPYYDLNNDLGRAQGQGSDGCEYLCSQNPPSSEQCNSVDDNCDGEIDNGLSADDKENNNSCSNAKSLTQVDTGGTSQFSTYTIYPIGDDDWFKIRVNEENDNICVACVDCESYVSTFELIDQPNGQDYVLEVRLQNSGCGSQPLTTRQNNTKVIDGWRVCPSFFSCLAGGDNQGCGSQDYRDYLVRVRPRGGNQEIQSCETYTLQVSHSAE